MPSRVRYSVCGKDNLTLREAARMLGRKPSTVLDYASRHNIGTQEALERYEQVSAETYIVGDRPFASFAEALEYLGKSYNAYTSWKGRHSVDDKQQWLNLQWSKRCNSAITVEGKTYARARDAVEGIGWFWQASLKYRQHHKCSWQEAIDTWLYDTSARTLKSNGRLREIRFCYIGTDNKAYYRCVCTECGAQLLLPRDCVGTFRHSEDFCHKYSSPVSISKWF